MLYIFDTYMARMPGLEPGFQDSESCVLPTRRLPIMAPSVGIEPTAFPLTADCSTDELRWNMAFPTRFELAFLSLTRRHVGHYTTETRSFFIFLTPQLSVCE